MRRRFCLLLIASSIAAPLFAQSAPPSSRIPTVTRLVKVFSELETSLVAKAHAPDAAQLEALLDPAFEVRMASQPGVPIARDDAVRELRASPRDVRIEQMAVHDVGDVALVSFREVVGASSRSKADRFVVDCWKRDGNGWKLLVRYANAPLGKPSAAPSRAPSIDKRY